MSAPIVLQILVNETNLLALQGVNPNLICPVIPAVGPRGPKGDTGIGLRRNIFIATQGQTEFTVDFDPVLNDNYFVFIDDAKQNRLLFSNVGNVVTVAMELNEGQVIEIFD